MFIALLVCFDIDIWAGVKESLQVNKYIPDQTSINVKQPNVIFTAHALYASFPRKP